MFDFFKTRRRKRLLAEPFRREWLPVLDRNVRQYALLPEDLQSRLRASVRRRFSVPVTVTVSRTSRAPRNREARARM